MKNYRETKLAALVAAAAMTVSGAAPAAVSEVDGAGGVFLNDKTLLGVEYRGKPDNFKSVGLAEDEIGDVFVAYFPNKNLALVGPMPTWDR